MSQQDSGHRVMEAWNWGPYLPAQLTYVTCHVRVPCPAGVQG